MVMTANERPNDVVVQRQRAEKLRQLHRCPRALVLCNAWDAASARIFEQAGFLAIATTSAGIANALGYADGEFIPREVMADAVRRIAAVVQVPVTADMEGGYGPSAEDAAAAARAVIEAGAVGMNFEDAFRETQLAEVSLQVERIKAIREAASSAFIGNIPLVLNARTDVYFARQGDASGWFAEAVRRANAYLEAGADCAFIPGVTDAEVIGRLVREVHGPLNVLAVPGSPSIAELESLGVRRVSLGSAPMRATLGLARRIAREILESGAYATIAEHAISYQEANGLFAGH
jgi:2-methylisocitrate lyase-like PEP mutase family enzyme